MSSGYWLPYCTSHYTMRACREMRDRLKRESDGPADGYHLLIEGRTPVWVFGPDHANRGKAEAAARWHRDMGGHAVILVHVVGGRPWVLSKYWGLPCGRTVSTSADRMHESSLSECYAQVRPYFGCEVVA